MGGDLDACLGTVGGRASRNVPPSAPHAIARCKCTPCPAALHPPTPLAIPPVMHGACARRAEAAARKVEDVAEGARDTVRDGAKAVGRKAEDAADAVKEAARDVRKS